MERKGIQEKTIVTLTLMDILSTARILWVDGHAQYAPLSIGDNLHGYPLIEENYNLMITVLIINIVVIIYKLIRKRYLQKIGLGKQSLCLYTAWFLFHA